MQRGGQACAYDRQLSTLQGNEAVKTVLEAKPGDPSHFIAIIENKIERQPLLEAVASTQAVADAIKAKDFQKAVDLRGPEFAEYYEAYQTTTATDRQELRLPPNKVRISNHTKGSFVLTWILANEYRRHPRGGARGWNELGDSSSSGILLKQRPQAVGHPQWLRRPRSPPPRQTPRLCPPARLAWG